MDNDLIFAILFSRITYRFFAGILHTLPSFSPPFFLARIPTHLVHLTRRPFPTPSLHALSLTPAHRYPPTALCASGSSPHCSSSTSSAPRAKWPPASPTIRERIGTCWRAALRAGICACLTWRRRARWSSIRSARALCLFWLGWFVRALCLKEVSEMMVVHSHDGSSIDGGVFSKS